MADADLHSLPDPYRDARRDLTLPRVSAALHAMSRAAAVIPVIVGVFVLFAPMLLAQRASWGKAAMSDER